MIDHNNNETAQLRAELSELRAPGGSRWRDTPPVTRRRRYRDPWLAKQQEQWATLFAASVETVRRSKEIGDARRDGLLPQLAIIKTRVRALEEAFHQMAGIVIEDPHDDPRDRGHRARRFHPK